MACEQALQLWRSEPLGNTRASALASPFACGSHVHSRESPKWRGCSRASSTTTAKKLLVSLFFLTVGKMVVVFFQIVIGEVGSTLPEISEPDCQISTRYHGLYKRPQKPRTNQRKLFCSLGKKNPLSFEHV